MALPSLSESENRAHYAASSPRLSMPINANKEISDTKRALDEPKKGSSPICGDAMGEA
jgi:hypothetical protein